MEIKVLNNCKCYVEKSGCEDYLCVLSEIDSSAKEDTTIFSCDGVNPHKQKEFLEEECNKKILNGFYEENEMKMEESRSCIHEESRYLGICCTERSKGSRSHLNCSPYLKKSLVKWYYENGYPNSADEVVNIRNRESLNKLMDKLKYNRMQVVQLNDGNEEYIPMMDSAFDLRVVILIFLIIFIGIAVIFRLPLHAYRGTKRLSSFIINKIFSISSH